MQAWIIGAAVMLIIIATARVVVGMFGQPRGWIKGQPPAMLPPIPIPPRAPSAPLLADDGRVNGAMVFDPRDGAWKVSTNPALILADLTTRSGGPIDWQATARHADYLDQKVSGRKAQ